MKIAVIGTAPSSMHLAPYDDPSWTIWGCSPAAMGIKRFDAWFEIHAWPEILGPHIPPTYLPWLASLKCPVYMIEKNERVPSSVTYPHAAIVEKFGPYFFTSTIAWMLAMAIEQPGVEEVGLWGVDMSATEEYGYQRAGCHYFLTVARQRGIKVTVPDQSDLLRPPTQYGFGNVSPMYRKLLTRALELDSRINASAVAYEDHSNRLHYLRGLKDGGAGVVGDVAAIDAQIASTEAAMVAERNQWHFLKGARSDNEYMLCTWVN